MADGPMDGSAADLIFMGSDGGGGAGAGAAVSSMSASASVYALRSRANTDKSLIMCGEAGPASPIGVDCGPFPNSAGAGPAACVNSRLGATSPMFGGRIPTTSFAAAAANNSTKGAAAAATHQHHPHQPFSHVAPPPRRLHKFLASVAQCSKAHRHIIQDVTTFGRFVHSTGVAVTMKGSRCPAPQTLSQLSVAVASGAVDFVYSYQSTAAGGVTDANAAGGNSAADRGHHHKAGGASRRGSLVGAEAGHHHRSSGGGGGTKSAGGGSRRRAGVSDPTEPLSYGLPNVIQVTRRTVAGGNTATSQSDGAVTASVCNAEEQMIRLLLSDGSYLNFMRNVRRGATDEEGVDAAAQLLPYQYTLVSGGEAPPPEEPQQQPSPAIAATSPALGSYAFPGGDDGESSNALPSATSPQTADTNTIRVEVSVNAAATAASAYLATLA